MVCEGERTEFGRSCGGKGGQDRRAIDLIDLSRIQLTHGGPRGGQGTLVISEKIETYVTRLEVGGERV